MKSTKRRSKRSNDGAKKTVSFRLVPTFMRQLTAMADERESQSPHDLARQLVIDALTRHDPRPQLESLTEQVLTMREDLVTAVAYALSATANLDVKTARKTAQDIFRNQMPKE